MESTNSSTHSHLERLFQRLLRIGRKLHSGAGAEDVHQLRTTARRIETFLAAHEDRLGGAAGKLARQMARLRRRAGRVRDLDVQMQLLRGVTVESITRERSRLMLDLERSRAKREKKMTAVLEREFTDALRKRMRKISEQLPLLTSAPEAEEYEIQALDIFAAVANDFAVLDETNLHDFRIACKGVRYTAELGEGPDAAKVVSECKRLQNTIGDWHDTVMLTKRAERLFSSTRSPLAAVLRTLRTAKLTDALRTAAEVKRNLLQLRREKQPQRRPQAVHSPSVKAAAS